MAEPWSNFGNCLTDSHEVANLPMWEAAYRKLFPTLRAMVHHPRDGGPQRAGIDRSLVLDDGRQVWVDEKARGRNKKTGLVYEDIALEYLSDAGRKAPGWVCKPLLAHYIAYAIVPLGRCYLLPVPQLQSAWVEWGERWKATYNTVHSPNSYGGHQWHTMSVAVPVDVLYQVLMQRFMVDLSPLPWPAIGTEPPF
jgi:hypothetical protein